MGVMLKHTPTLLDRLAEADRAWRRKAKVAVWRVVPPLLGLATLAIALDAFLQLSAGARVGWLALAGLALASALAAVRWIGWHRKNPPERTARHLEQRDPSLGSGLINALQLAGQAQDPSLAPLTRTLAADAALLPPNSARSTSPHSP